MLCLQIPCIFHNISLLEVLAEDFSWQAELNAGAEQAGTTWCHGSLNLPYRYKQGQRPSDPVRSFNQAIVFEQRWQTWTSMITCWVRRRVARQLNQASCQKSLQRLRHVQSIESVSAAEKEKETETKTETKTGTKKDADAAAAQITDGAEEMVIVISDRLFVAEASRGKGATGQRAFTGSVFIPPCLHVCSLPNLKSCVQGARAFRSWWRQEQR
jgi:hypothetical protein